LAQERTGRASLREARLHRQTGRALMPRLLLLRHAKSAWPAGAPDLERPLNARGRAAALRMGTYLRDEGLRPDLSVVSPARRTAETWNQVQAALGDLAGDLAMRYDSRIYEA